MLLSEVGHGTAETPIFVLKIIQVPIVQPTHAARSSTLAIKLLFRLATISSYRIKANLATRTTRNIIFTFPTQASYLTQKFLTHTCHAETVRR